MSLIQVDGCEYVVERDGRYGVDTVAVYSEVEGRVPFMLAEAEVDHNMEQVCIDYQAEYDNTVPVDEYQSTYNYWEYTTPEELAAWMVSTHPESG